MATIICEVPPCQTCICRSKYTSVDNIWSQTKTANLSTGIQDSLFAAISTVNSIGHIKHSMNKLIDNKGPVSNPKLGLLDSISLNCRVYFTRHSIQLNSIQFNSVGFKYLLASKSLFACWHFLIRIMSFDGLDKGCCTPHLLHLVDLLIAIWCVSVQPASLPTTLHHWSSLL